MTLILSIPLILDESLSSNLPSLVYCCPTIETRRIDDNSGYSHSPEKYQTEASINLGSLLTVSDDIDTCYRVLTDENLFFTAEEQNIEVGDSPDSQRDLGAIRSQLQSDLRTTLPLLNQAWSQESWQPIRDLLIRLMDVAQPTELIRLVISTNDPRRIESIFFQGIESIRTRQDGTRRNISVTFIPL